MKMHFVTFGMIPKIMPLLTFPLEGLSKYAKIGIFGMLIIQSGRVPDCIIKMLKMLLMKVEATTRSS
jgi:hypothetical protein